MTLKSTLKSVAMKHGLHATFMPKPITGVSGNGMHVHQSLFTKDDNAFYSSTDPYKLSENAYYFLGGQMKHIMAMCAILNPSVNSYKRLIPGYEASTYICWARINRSALVRVPRYSPGKEKSTRLEIRCPDSSSNPYLAFAVLLKAGLDGIKNKISPPEAVEEDVFEFSEKELEMKNIEVLPRNLYQSLLALKENSIIGSVLGPELLKKYIRAKMREWDEYSIHVSDWEVREYLENI
jgi:glutamine synthetase